MTCSAALRKFFSTKDRPVENRELMDFIKNDRQGYDELADLALAALGETLTTPA